MSKKNGNAVIKVLGVGGSGCNAITHMVTSEIEGVEFISINTDIQALSNNVNSTKIQLGDSITKGLGAGANPEIGKQAAEADIEIIKENIKSSDMVFIACGMGGGTGTGAAPIIAKASKDLGVLTIAVVTKPFEFEGNKRMNFAEEGIAELRNNVDAILVIPNEKLSQVFGEDMNLYDAFARANQVLHDAVQGISEIITNEGFINVDFNDVKTVMRESGTAMMGVGISASDSDNKAEEAARKAIDCPLLEDADLNGAKGLIVNIASDGNIKIGDFKLIGKIIQEITHKDATIITGTSIDQNLNGAIKVTIVATGLDTNPKTNLNRKESVYGKLTENLNMKNRNRSIVICADEDNKKDTNKSSKVDIKGSDDDEFLSNSDLINLIKREEDLSKDLKDSSSKNKDSKLNSILPTFLRKQIDD